MQSQVEPYIHREDTMDPKRSIHLESKEPTCLLHYHHGHPADFSGQGLHNNLEEHIQNHLPIYLLRVKDMTLVRRSDVQNQISQEIKKHYLICDTNTCRCFDELKRKMRFAILSHRWSDDELSFQDLSETTKCHGNQFRGNMAIPPRGVSAATLRQVVEQAKSEGEVNLLEKMLEACSGMSANCGFTKLVKFCEIAIKEHCEFVWLDTVCINKESSAELEESIRSMFGWYRDSYVCIVHLGQTKRDVDLDNDPWFKRGWTLQELLAPQRVLFFKTGWGRMTDRNNDKDTEPESDGPSLMRTIARITNIPVGDLINFKPGLKDIRQRMSWASQRKTTRIEDMAYCLIGIFDLSLSVAYGEREKAFYRLQVEIMQRSSDRSLFFWKGRSSAYNSMLAARPECFTPISGNAVSCDYLPAIDTHPSYTLTNFGLRISLEHMRDVAGKENVYLLARLPAPPELKSPRPKCLAVVLKQVSDQVTPQYKREEIIICEPPVRKGAACELFIT